ncbi:MAG: DUF6884 domain-containing protein [Actinomycetota bacterium]
MSDRVGLVGCVKKKLERAAPARDLYSSPLFRGRRAYVERTCGRWFILSAKHGLVDPDEVLEPYDVTLDSSTATERRAWSDGVLVAIRERLGSLDGLTFEAHAGSNYLDFGLVEGLRVSGARVERPAEGLGLFEQQAFYSSGQRRDPQSEEARISSPRGGAGKYAPLATYLAGNPAGWLDVGFDEIDALVSGLPTSAHRHRAWWANDATHSQAHGWLDAGWRVATVDMDQARVRFETGH